MDFWWWAFQRMFQRIAKTMQRMFSQKRKRKRRRWRNL